MRKPREAYARVVVERDNVDLIVGLEVRAAELAVEFYPVLERLVDEAVRDIPATEPDDVFAVAVEEAVKSSWPDRAYFLEIGRDDHRWVQIFQPWGIPRER